MNHTNTAMSINNTPQSGWGSPIGRLTAEARDLAAITAGVAAVGGVSWLAAQATSPSVWVPTVIVLVAVGLLELRRPPGVTLVRHAASSPLVLTAGAVILLWMTRGMIAAWVADQIQQAVHDAAADVAGRTETAIHDAAKDTVSSLIGKWGGR